MNAKEVAFAEDLSVAGSFNGIKNYWEKSTATGSNMATSLTYEILSDSKRKNDGSAKFIH